MSKADSPFWAFCGWHPVPFVHTVHGLIAQANAGTSRLLMTFPSDAWIYIAYITEADTHIVVRQLFYHSHYHLRERIAKTPPAKR